MHKYLKLGRWAVRQTTATALRKAELASLDNGAVVATLVAPVVETLDELVPGGRGVGEEVREPQADDEAREEGKHLSSE